MTVNLLRYGVHTRTEYETTGERAAHNKLVAESVGRLFAILGTWNVHESHEMRLQLGFKSPCDPIIAYNNLSLN